MPCDLHCHTRISDGSLGVEELLSIAKRRGVTTIAITDHDAVAGSTRATVIGKRFGITVIPGVEFSAFDTARQNKAHILGYMCDAPDRLEGMCRRIIAERRAAATEMIKKVMRYYPILPDSVIRCASGSTCVYMQHIMHALMDAGYTDSIHGEVFKKLFSSEGGCALVKMEYPDVREVIDLIHSAGGLAVIAHPASYHNEELMQELNAEGLLDGVEVWHPNHSESDSARLQAFAEENGLICTGGSDFHGMYTLGKARPLASATAPATILNDMKNRKALLPQR